ncbi:MAG: sugar ABC transporter ATP-binding protein, partial [Anaerolineae bacterium]
KAKRQGLGVIFITHNPNHAYPVGDHFVILRRGRILADYRKDEVTQQELVNLMAGGEDLVKLQQELADLLEEPVEVA